MYKRQGHGYVQTLVVELITIIVREINDIGVRIRGVVLKGEWRIMRIIIEVSIIVSLEGVIGGEASPVIGECREILTTEVEGDMLVTQTTLGVLKHCLITKTIEGFTAVSYTHLIAIDLDKLDADTETFRLQSMLTVFYKYKLAAHLLFFLDLFVEFTYFSYNKLILI